jgi:hypothetical protein
MMAVRNKANSSLCPNASASAARSTTLRSKEVIAMNVKTDVKGGGVLLAD